MRDDGSDRDSEWYDIHGIVGIGVKGCHNPVARVIHRELQYFRRPIRSADLTVVLGSVPSADWVPHGSPVGDDLLCDGSTDQVTVLRRSTPALSKDNVRFLIQGDIRNSGNPVSIYVPSLSMDMPRWLKAAHVLLKSNFLSDAEILADDILTGFVEPFLYYRLPDHGYSLLHASAVSKGSGILFYGASNVGKTSMALHLAQEGFEFHGDDLVIVNERGQLFSYPKRIKLEAHHLTAFPSLIQKISARMGPGKGVLFKRFAKGSSERPFAMMFYHPVISEIFEDVRTGQRCDLGAVVYLRRGVNADFRLHEVEMESCRESLAANLFWEFDMPGYRYNRYRHCLAYVSRRDFLRQEVDHHDRVTRLVTRAVSKARAFELHLPFPPDARHAQRAIDRLLTVLG